MNPVQATPAGGPSGESGPLRTPVPAGTANHPPALVVGGIGLVRSVGVAGIRTIVGSDVAESASYYSRYCDSRLRLPGYRTDAFIDALVEAGRGFGRKTVFLTDDDRALLNASRHRDRIAPYFYFNFPDHATVEAILDKEAFAALAARLHLPVPKTIVPSSADELRSALNEFLFPLIMKPAHQEDWWHPNFRKYVGGYRKAIECRDPETLMEFYSRIVNVNPHVIVQELITGDDSEMVNTDFYCPTAGTISGYYGYRKHRSYPVHAGTGCFVETIDTPELREVSGMIASRLGMKGYCNIQFKRDSRSGILKVIEVHTRVSIWEHLGTLSGMNLIAAGYHDMVGDGQPVPAGYRAGVKGINLYRDLRALPGYLKLGEWGIGRWLKSLAGTRYYFVFDPSDPMPCLYDFWLRVRSAGRRLFRRNTVNNTAV